MKKMFVQDIEAAKPQPGPGEYQHKKTFSSDGLFYTMRPHTGFEMSKLLFKSSIFSTTE